MAYPDFVQLVPRSKSERRDGTVITETERGEPIVQKFYTVADHADLLIEHELSAAEFDQWEDYQIANWQTADNMTEQATGIVRLVRIISWSTSYLTGGFVRLTVGLAEVQS